MKPLVCVYCEGNDTKIAVLNKENEQISVIRAASFDFLNQSQELPDLGNLNLDGDLGFGSASDTQTISSVSHSTSSINLINSALRGINLSNCLFLTALTEPSTYYHVFEGVKSSKNAKITQEIVSDIQSNKNIRIDRESVGYVEMADQTLLSVFISDDVPCFKMISALARANGKRFYKIPSVKNAEISLAYYVSKRKKFFPDDHSLIVYIGKDYSKLIFMQGRKLKHIGSTLDIGTANLHTYDVYFSKILLEMENGGINTLDNIVVCGEDDSENLVLSFYGTFPEATVSRLEFDDLDLSLVDPKDKETFSAFSVPIAIASEYFDELDGITKGINLVPKYLKEDQKVFQWAWHGYAILPLLFGATFFFTMQILKNNKEINRLQNDIYAKQLLIAQNQAVVDQINEYQAKINSFGQTKIILDSASVGTGVWNKLLYKTANYFGGYKGLWLTKLDASDLNKATLEGYSLNKQLLTSFASQFKNAMIKSVTTEDLNKKTVYKYSLLIDLSEFK